MSIVKALVRLEADVLEALGQVEAGIILTLFMVLRSLEAGGSPSTCTRKGRRQEDEGLS